MSSLTTKILLTDAVGAYDSEEFALVYVLNSWGEPNLRCVSLPAMVEDDAVNVQESISRWLHLFKTALHSAACAELHTDPTLAELHPLFEGNYATTPEHFELAQLIVFCRSLEGRDITEIVYSGSSSAVSRCLTRWCKMRNVAFSGPRLRSPLRSRIESTLSRWRAWFRLYQLCRTNSPIDYRPLQAVSTAFVDYFVADPIDTYWPALRNLIAQDRDRYFFIHQYTKHSALSTVAAAKSHCTELQRASSQPHRKLLESVVTASDFPNIRKHAAVLRRMYKLSITVTSPTLPYLAGLEPISLYSEKLARGWNDSTVVDSALKLVAFHDVLSALPNLKQVVFLQENHRWEKTLLREVANRGIRSIGVPHTVVRPRDLRYQAIVRDSQSDRFLFPNTVATNGPATRDELAKGIADERLTSVEAQRYESLTNVRRVTTPSRPVILIVGDLLPRHSQFILDTALPVLRQMNSTVYFKPHPADLGSRALAEAHGAVIIGGDFRQALSCASLVIAGSLTAATAEAVHVGLPVVTIVDPAFFNLSPLLYLPFARYARTPLELRTHLDHILSNSVDEQREMFTIDQTLWRWRKLLSVD